MSTRLLSVAALLALGAALTGCTGGSVARSADPSAPTSDTAPVTEPSSPDDPDPSPTPSCSEFDGAAALRHWIGDVPQPPDLGFSVVWDAQNADVSGYDPCAALSWIVLPIERGTASSPYQIMLFHNGDYLGTATKRAYGFFPNVVRDSDDAVSVTYTWPRDDESNADASAHATATFTWDGTRVVMSGDLPSY